MAVSRGRLCLSQVTTRTALWPQPGERTNGPVATVCGDMLSGATAMRAAHGRPSRPRGAIAECVLRVCAWRVAMVWCSRDVWPASCTETRGMWHRRIVGSCAGRGGEACDRAVAACGLRHAPMRMACGAVVSWAAVWGAVEVCDRAVDTCGLRHAPQRMACGTVVARVAVRGAVEMCCICGRVFAAAAGTVSSMSKVYPITYITYMRVQACAGVHRCLSAVCVVWCCQPYSDREVICFVARHRGAVAGPWPQDGLTVPCTCHIGMRRCGIMR